MAPIDEIRNDDLQPRPKRKRNRKSSDRGLPPDAEIRRLTKAYLKTQWELWPELANSEMLPKSSDAIIERMVEEYKQRHRTGRLTTDAANLFKEYGQEVLMGTVYCRYSCDNSSPLSIIDQLHNALVTAREERRFIPWEFVFADYSVSGLDSSRRGYANCKSLIKDHRDSVDTMYIDEFTRASRDSLEWWRLAADCQRAKLRMIGASDGFDLSSSDWDIKVTIYGLISRLFIRDLRGKVLRGMKGGARRRTVLGKLPLGYTKKHLRDEAGQVVRRPNGKPLSEPAIDPESAKLAHEIFDLYTVKLWSPFRIAKYLNRSLADGTDTWTESSVKKILKNPACIGVFIWNRTRREFDYETEKWTKVENPKSEWIVNYEPDVAILPMDLWRATQRRRSQSKGKKRKRSRNQRSATTLLSGTLHCGYCGKELTLFRSGDKYKNMHCTNGTIGAHGCQLSSSKSTRITEECVLSYIKEVVLNEQAVQDLIEEANAHLRLLAARPAVDVAPIQSRMNELRSKIDRLVKRVSNLPEDREEARDGYERQIVQLQREMNGLRTEFREKQSQNATPPPLLSPDAAERYLNDMRAVLDQEVPQAAEAIRQLTGPIEIRQQKIEGKRGARWIASFSPNLPELLRHVSHQNAYPDSVTLEYLCHANWTTSPSVEFPIDRIPKYEELAPKFREMREAGKTIREIASAHHVSWQVAYETIEFARTGQRPCWYTADDPIRYLGWEHYEEIAPLVAELRDQNELDWPEIVEQVREHTGHAVSTGTALRAYEYAHRRETRQSAGIGTKFRPRCGTDKFQQFRELVKQGITNGSELARRVGISRNTANRWKKRVNDEQS